MYGRDKPPQIEASIALQTIYMLLTVRTLCEQRRCVQTKVAAPGQVYLVEFVSLIQNSREPDQ